MKENRNFLLGGFYFFMKHRQKKHSFKDVYKRQGYIFVTQEYTDLTMKSLQQFMVDNSSTYFLAFILIILICLSIAYMIVRPIRRIETTAKHIARKEFDYPIDTVSYTHLY